MKSEKKRANLENAPPLRYYPTTLLGAHQHQIPASHSETRRRIRKSARYWLPSQNLRIGTLNAARDHAVPSANFGGWLQSQSDSAAKGKFFRETDCFFSQIAVTLKRQGAKIKCVQSSPASRIKHWVVSIFFTCVEFRQMSSCALATRIRARIG